MSCRGMGLVEEEGWEVVLQRVAIVGCGTLGRAVLGGLRDVACGLEVVAVSARREETCRQLSEAYSVFSTTDNKAAVENADLVVLAVKPSTVASVLGADGMAPLLKGRILVSVAAGITTARLAELAPDARIVRAMPNTPCRIREGMTVLAPGPGADTEVMDLAVKVFEVVGRVRVLEEKHLDAVTGLSGSGPAFAYVMLEALADGGVRMGLPRDVANELAAQTMQGAARLALHSGEHPASLKDDVTTPAGCTIAGLLTMEDGRIRSVLARTIEEATKVASGLGS
jgi:pyrroline-5-carboxylate reductase